MGCVYIGYMKVFSILFQMYINGLFGAALIVPILVHGFYNFFLFVIERIVNKSGDSDLTDEQAI